jgi:microcystin-dependent protein
LPTGYLATTGTTIQVGQHNPPFEDIASALSGSLPRNGTAPMTAPLKLADGAAAAPGLAFASNPGTGWFKTTAGFGFAVGGVQVAELGASGFISGSRFLGELIPYTRSVAPPLTVFPVGQTLSRATYAALWAVAQVEIAAGNPLYNNGDGTTTFGIPDLRGRVVAAVDNMGGASAGRFTPALGTGLGIQNQTLSASNIPPHTHSGTTGNDSPDHTHLIGGSAPMAASGAPTAQALTVAGSGGSGTFNAGGASARHAHSFTTDGGAGLAGAAFSVTQPTIVCNYLLFAGA